MRLPRLIPQRIAMEAALTGDMIGAERLYQYGLINVLVEPGEALEEAKKLARRIMANAPLAVAASKQVIIEQRDWPIDEMFTRQESITGHLLKTADAREGASAFAEKRAPQWRGE
jgi:enoyl-CoA hydratase